jgi:hypothetical protein
VTTLVLHFNKIIAGTVICGSIFKNDGVMGLSAIIASAVVKDLL